MAKVPPASLRFRLLVEPAGVTSLPLPRSSAELPPAVKLPVTVSVALPPMTGLAPVIVSSLNGETLAASRFSVALLTVRLDGSASAPDGAFRFSVPPVRARAGSVRPSPLWRLSVPAETVSGSSTAGASPSSSVTVPPLTVSPAPPAGLEAAESVRVPPLKARVVPAARA